jgi:DNA-directed RNA polymerase specialized sigma24 family protein
MRSSIDLRRLVRAAAAGDPRAWDTLVERFGALVWSTTRAYGLSPEEGANAAQTTWLRLAEQLDRLDQHDRLGEWLAATARRESLRLLSVKRPAVANAPQTAPGSSAPAEPAEPRREALLWGIIHQLPEHCRRLLRILSAIPTPSHEEVAAALDLPAASVPAAQASCFNELRYRIADIQG